MVFRRGDRGLGYYIDRPAIPISPDNILPPTPIRITVKLDGLIEQAAPRWQDLGAVQESVDWIMQQCNHAATYTVGKEAVQVGSGNKKRRRKTAHPIPPKCTCEGRIVTVSNEQHIRCDDDSHRQCIVGN